MTEKHDKYNNKEYNYTSFTCLKCSYTTREIENIDLHNKNCGKTKSLKEEDERISVILNSINEVKNKLTELEKSIENKKTYEVELKLERFKNKVYRYLIEKNSSIIIDDILEEKDDGIHVYNLKNGQLPVFFHDFTRNILTETDTVPIDKFINVTLKSEKENIKNRKNTYRTVKNHIKLKEEPTKEDKELHINTHDKNISTQLNIIKKYDDVKDRIKEHLLKLQNSRSYTKILEEVRNIRLSIFGSMSIIEYINFLTDQVKLIEDVFIQKKYTVKKYTAIISKGLSPLESRLINYRNYVSFNLEVDEVEKLDDNLNLHTVFEKKYKPFQYTEISKLFYNYGSVLFSIKKNLERYLFNNYGFYNLIFLPLDKNSDDDPYSFYLLEKSFNEKRYWKMDCRLEDFSSNIVANILPYFISMFRKIYNDVFNDNEFRSDFTKRSQITELDCEQLIQNIILMGQPRKFCNIIRQLVKKKATYNPTTNDKFNLHGDDALQKKRFLQKDEINLLEIMRQLFDGISEVDAVEFYRSQL